MACFVSDRMHVFMWNENKARECLKPDFFFWLLNRIIMVKWLNGKMTSWDAEMKGSTQRFWWGDERGLRLLLAGRCSLGVEGYRPAAVRETVAWIAHVGCYHGSWVHKIFLVWDWKQNVLLIRKGKKELRSLKRLGEGKLNTTGFTFPVCKTVF